MKLDTCVILFLFSFVKGKPLSGQLVNSYFI
nr:MAG TPA: hypothetical protein [Caudoviricetes sp.]